MKYLLAVGVAKDDELLIAALAEVLKTRAAQVVHINDTSALAAAIGEQDLVPVRQHADDAQIQISEEDIVAIVASTKALRNDSGVVKALDMEAIPFRWELCRAELKQI